MRRPPAPDTRLSPEERAVLGRLAPLRVTVEQLVRRMHLVRGGGEPPPGLVAADVEAVWTVVLEAFRRGVTAVHQGVHRAEGLDHHLADEALEAALRGLSRRGPGE